MSGQLPVLRRTLLQAGDDGEWQVWQQKGDAVTHIELRKWADCLVIAPLSANTLAKIAQVPPPQYVRAGKCQVTGAA